MRRNWVSATRPDGEVVYLNLATARALSFEGKHTTVSWSEGPGGSIHVLESPIDLLTQIEGEEAAGLLLDEPQVRRHFDAPKTNSAVGVDFGR